MFQMARKAIEHLYVGVCDVYDYEQSVDPINKRTTQSEVLSIQNQPCRISFSAIDSVDEVSHVPVKRQIVKLFVAPELNIKAGSKIHVVQHGISNWYKSSGEPAFYASHQEIMLTLLDGKA